MDEKEHKIGQATPGSWRLSEEQKLNYQSLYILYLITEGKVQFPNYMSGKLRFIEKAMDFLENKNLIKQKEEFDERKVLGFNLGKTNINWVFEETEEAKKIVDGYRKQYREYLRLYDVYAHVDPNEGEFALSKFKKILLKENGKEAWKQYKNLDKWVDYRVPVSVYKGIDVRGFIFFSLIEEGRFVPTPEDTEHQWAEDLFMETIWEEMYTILESAPKWEEQGDEENPSSEIMESIIIEGAAVLEEQRKKLKKFIKEQDQILEIEDEIDHMKGEHDSDDEEYFEDPVYYHGDYYYSPFRDPFFWVTAAILI